MLADPRRKQKISTNPNGLLFSSDESNIGQKLMSQMGWEKGKGLGANEQGNKDPIKVRMNVESRGLGCKRSDVDKWIAHQDDFNSLLANLNQTGASTETSAAETEKAPSSQAVQSLESKSKSSRSRVHYMKFTKGKDLSRHSEKDLSCILGPSRSSNATPVNSAPPSKPASRANSDNEEGSSDPFLSDAIHVTSTMSLQEYFASKMASKKNSSSNLLALASKTPSPDPITESVTVGEAKASFFIGEPSPEEGTENAAAENTEKKQKKKKKDKNKDLETPPAESMVTEATENQADSDEDAEKKAADKARRKKLRKKRRREEERLRQEEAEAARHRSGGKTKPKPPDDTMKFVSEESSSEPEQDEPEPPKKKKSKKRKHRASSEENHREVSIEKEESPVKKSKSDSNIQAQERPDDVIKPKKSKKKKNKERSGE